MRRVSWLQSHLLSNLLPLPPARETHLAHCEWGAAAGNHLLFTEAPRTRRVQFPSLASKTNLLLSAPGRNTKPYTRRFLQRSLEVWLNRTTLRGEGRRVSAAEAAQRPQQLLEGAAGARPQLPRPRSGRTFRNERRPASPGRTACLARGARQGTLRLHAQHPATDKGYRRREGGALNVPRRRGQGRTGMRVRRPVPRTKQGRPRTAPRRRPGTRADARHPGLAVRSRPPQGRAHSRPLTRCSRAALARRVRPRPRPCRPLGRRGPDPRSAGRGPQRRPLRHLPGPRRPPPALSPAGCPSSRPASCA